MPLPSQSLHQQIIFLNLIVLIYLKSTNSLEYSHISDIKVSVKKYLGDFVHIPQSCMQWLYELILRQLPERFTSSGWIQLLGLEITHLRSFNPVVDSTAFTPQMNRTRVYLSTRPRHIFHWFQSNCLVRTRVLLTVFTPVQMNCITCKQITLPFCSPQ